MNKLSGEGSPSAALPRVAVVNDYELVLAGVAAMLGPYTDRLRIADPISIDEPVTGPPVDLALYDTFGREGIGNRALERLLKKDNVRRAAVYTADASDESVRIALDLGVAGYLSKATPAAQLVEQIERIVGGEVVVETNSTGATSNRQARAWPGKDAGLSERESEIVALVALGRRNAEIAAALYISVETVKTHLSHAFRKLALTNRTQVASFVLRDDSFRHRGES